MTTRGKSSSKSKRTQHTRELFQWFNQVKADRKLPPSAFLVAFEIGQHFNCHRGGCAWPSLRTIGANVGLSESSAARLVHLLWRRNHLEIDFGEAGRGHSNQYFMVLQKPPQAEVLQPTKPTQKPPQAKVFEKIKPPSVKLKPPPVEVNNLEQSMAPLREPIDERESALRAEPQKSAGDVKVAAPFEEEERADATSKEEKNGQVHLPAPVDQVHQYFRDLQAIWPRPWPDDENLDKRAFVKACREADPADIIEAAKAWVAAADAPRFLKSLDEWLSNRGWEKTPPKRNQRTNGHGKSMGEMMREAGRQQPANVIYYRGVGR